MGAKGIPSKSIFFETTEQAQNAPAPFTTYSLFYNGEFLTNEILSQKKFEKIVTEHQLRIFDHTQFLPQNDPMVGLQNHRGNHG